MKRRAKEINLCTMLGHSVGTCVANKMAHFYDFMNHPCFREIGFQDPRTNVCMPLIFDHFTLQFFRYEIWR